MSSFEIGEGFVGHGADAAHVNTMLGRRSGPVGTAFATALATPSSGHVPFLCVYRPGVPCEPPTLFVNKAAVAGPRHAELTWGAAQVGVAEAVAECASVRFTPSDLAEWLLIVAVWVDPAADDSDAIRRNNREATAIALATGQAVVEGRAGAESISLWRSGEPAGNPYFEPR